MQKIIRHFFLLILLFGNFKYLDAQKINIRSEYQQFIRLSRQTPQAPKTYIIKTNKPIHKATLIENDIEILRILDEQHAIVRSQHEIDFDDIIYKAPANDNWKLDPLLSRLQDVENITILVKSTNALVTINFINSTNKLQIQLHQNSLIYLKGNPEEIKSLLLPRAEVIYMGYEDMTPTTESRVIDLNLNVNTINKIHNDYPALNGNGFILSIQESRFDPHDIDLIGRYLESPLEDENAENHATDMATIAGGAGNSFVNGRGVANAVTFTSSSNVGALPDADSDYTSLGVTIQNHSYGTSFNSIYGAQAQAFDLSSNNNENLLHVFSSGNSGLSSDTTGTYAGITGFANLTGNIKMAKNTLTVGSVDTVGREISFVSRGPAHDGRIKPEVVTYSMSGSSNSASLVSGLSILLQQAYQDQFGTLPPSALIKALIINSARDVLNPGPDHISGFGNVDGYRTLENLRGYNFYSGAVSQGNTQNFNLVVPNNVENLKVTLVWNDPAANINSGKALVNDLDLEISNGSSTWLPWVLNTEPDITSLKQNAVTNKDRLNNIEQITISNPVGGNYSIDVSGFDIPNGTQTFYIAYQWDEKEAFQWTFPTASDNMPYDGETIGYFRWNSTLSATLGQLEISTDNGSTWDVIDPNVDLLKGHYRWDAPEINSKALVRMVVNNTQFESESFNISRPLRISVGFNCNDSIALQWPAIANANKYEVFNLGDKYLEGILTTTDTLVILNKADFNSKFFSLKTSLNDGTEIIKSYAVSYELQGVGCYILSFFPELTENQELFINLELGTYYGVEEVIFERMGESEFELFTSVTPLTSASIKVQDTNPNQGHNLHRARILLQNGEEIITEPIETYFLTEIPFLIFPNPLFSGDDLKVFTKSFQDEQVKFELYNRMGQLVLEKEIISDREFIPLDINPGLYIYHIYTNTAEATGRIMIR